MNDALKIARDKTDSQFLIYPYTNAVKEEHFDALKAERAIVDERMQRLREALQGLLLSADASWEEVGNNGHDWCEACIAARASIKDTPC